MPIQIHNQTDASYMRRSALLEEAAREFHAPLLRYVFGMTRHWQDAENIVQDLWRYVLVYFPEGNIKKRGVLFDKARKLVIDHYRSSKRKPVVDADELPEHCVAKQGRDAYTKAEEVRLRIAFFEQYPDLNLSESQKDVLWLHARYGFTYAEIKEITGTSVSTIGDWIALGRKEIANQLNEEGK